MSEMIEYSTGEQRQYRVAGNIYKCDKPDHIALVERRDIFIGSGDVYEPFVTFSTYKER